MLKLSLAFSLSLLLLLANEKVIANPDQLNSSEFLFNNYPCTSDYAELETITSLDFLVVEKMCLLSYFKKFRQAAVGVYSTLEARKEKISVYKVKELKMKNGMVCLAYTKNNNLLVSRAFFEANPELQQHCIFHELVHLADSDFVFSYSLPWVRFAKKIVEAKLSKAHLFDPLPNLYGPVNLQELLAEYYVDNLDGKRYPTTKTFRTAIHSFPTPSQNKWVDVMKRAQEDIRSGNVCLATKRLNLAARLQPSHPLPLHYLSCLSARKGDLIQTEQYFDQVLERISALELPDGDKFRDNCLRQLILNFEYSANFQGTLELLKYYSLYSFDQRWWNQQKAYCLKQISGTQTDNGSTFDQQSGL